MNHELRYTLRPRLGRASLLIIAAVSFTACGGEEPAAEVTGPLMRPGEDCLSCHSEGAGRGAPIWSLGGTVYAQPGAAADEGVGGVEVLVSDENGKLLETLITNQVGNFYTATPLPQGFGVTLRYAGESIAMPCPPPAGLCNACHSDAPIGQALGRIYIPQGAPSTRPALDCSTF